jgi:prepilin peptidase CpaA
VTLLPPLALLAAAVVYDLKSREIPDWISLALAAWAVLAAALGLHAAGWLGAAAGLALGFALTAPLFYLGGLGGGDVKLIAALGAALGPLALLSVLFWMAVAGGVLALVAKYRGEKDFAYVPAIAAGLLIYCLWPEGLSYVV